MAISYNGVNQYYRYTPSTEFAPIERPPITICAWAYPLSTSASASPFGFAVSTTTRSPVFLNQFSSARWGLQSIRSDTGSAVQVLTSATNTVVANQWQFVLGWMSADCTDGGGCTLTSWAIARSATSGEEYERKDVVINKASPTPFPILPSGQKWNRVSIGGLLRTTAGFYYEGYVAETAAWNVILDDDEIASLGRGIKPNMIRPQNLRVYVPGIRSIGELKESIPFEAVNSPPFIDDHPRRYG